MQILKIKITTTRSNIPRDMGEETMVTRIFSF